MVRCGSPAMSGSPLAVRSPADDPGVAARRLGALDPLGVEHRQGVRAETLGDVRVEQLRRERPEEQVDAPEDAERRPRLPGARRRGIRPEVEQRDLRCAREPLGERVVDTVDVCRQPRPRLRVQPLEAAPHRRLEQHLPGEAVPGEPVGADVLGGATLHAPPVVLDLPGAVEGGDPALQPGQLQDVVGAQVRDADGVAPHLGGHVASRRRPQPCQRSTSMRAVTRGRSRTR